ncbi:MAG TPA: substrate-binding domain-containing protein [Cyclobacteriaceae bacterium]|jgi:D-xylose transport system substrate-binding protein|nr:substrate-binding domain-containing protein [Cyclobacteriaceae bacterium]
MKLNFAFRIMMLVMLSAMGSSLHAQKIGLLLDSYVTDRWYIDQKLFTDKVKELGGEVQIEVAYGEAVEQVRLGKKMIADGCKVLVIIAVDAAKAVEIVEEAKKANVPVLSYDRLINTNDIAVYISYNNEKVGELQAQYALTKIPKGKFLLLNGPVTDNNAILYRNGQLKVLKKSMEEGKIKLVGDLVMADWGEIGALMKIDEFMSSGKQQPDAIIAANDALANGSIDALKPELKGKILITGQDADLNSMRNIIAGYQTMTIYKPIKPLAQLGGEIAMKLAKGEKIEGTTKLKFGNIEVASILLDPSVVDKSNYKETVVKDGHVSLSELLDKK